MVKRLRTRLVHPAMMVLLLGPAGLLADPPEGEQPEEKPCGFFLGVLLEPVGPALRAHLGLEEGQGMTVKDVLKGSPADRAGIRKHDIILSAGEKSITSVADLTALLDKAKGEEITLKILRAGKEAQVKVVPEIRSTTRVVLDTKRVDLLKEPLRLQLVHPGVVIKQKLATLPEGLAVTITKEGDKPAEIKVEKGEKRWETVEGKLDSLPEDIRRHVEQLLAGTGFPVTSGTNYIYSIVGGAGEGDSLKVYRVEVHSSDEGERTLHVTPTIKAKKGKVQELGSVVRRRVIAEPQEGDTRKELEKLQKQIDRRFEELNRMIEEIRKALDELAEPRESSPEGSARSRPL